MINITDGGSYLVLNEGIAHGDYFTIAKNAIALMKNQSQVLILTKDTQTVIRAYDYATIQTPASANIDDLMTQLGAIVFA